MAATVTGFGEIWVCHLDFGVSQPQAIFLRFRSHRL